MTEAPELADGPAFGFSDDELATCPTPFRDGLFAGRRVLVTGGGSGLGKAIATLFARLGAEVALAGRKRERLEATATFLRGFGGRVVVQPMTIRDPADVAACFDALGMAMGGIDILVNNAGGQFPQPAIDFSVKGWNAVIDTNLNGTWYMMQAA
ncbi:MAG: citronellol/citronellal dehydrogenase, partial [Streptosporangiaceae bacterium]|nr:citronellol/citronellal dehydrogenase [Streptosporangiaceae bacterium]